MIIGHRGAAGLAPENTLSAFRKAAELGIQWVEVDTQLCADGTPMIFHDETVDRCTDGSGKVETLTLPQLRELDAGSWFGESFTQERIPTLEEAFRFCMENNMGMNLEIKIHYDEQVDALVKKVAEVIRATDFPHDSLLLSSFSKTALNACHTLLPEFRLGYITEETSSEFLDEVEKYDLYSIHVNQATLTEEMAEKIKSRDYILNIWTMNDPAKVDTFTNMGVDNIITDDPSLF